MPIRCCPQQTERAAHQHQQQLPLGLNGQLPTTEALAALYAQLGASAAQVMPQHQPQLMDPSFGQQVCEGTASLPIGDMPIACLLRAS